jgi:hypothetical protein
MALVSVVEVLRPADGAGLRMTNFLGRTGHEPCDDKRGFLVASYLGKRSAD